jgi:hypothetical protein
MYEDDSLDWETERIDNSRPPLRWVANLFGEISGWAVLRLSYAEEYDQKIKTKIYGLIFDKTWPLYDKYGTVYKIKWDQEDSI